MSWAIEDKRLFLDALETVHFRLHPRKMATAHGAPCPYCGVYVPVEVYSLEHSDSQDWSGVEMLHAVAVHNFKPTEVFINMIFQSARVLSLPHQPLLSDWRPRRRPLRQHGGIWASSPRGMESTGGTTTRHP